MIPVYFNHENHAIFFWEPGAFNFALWNPKLFNGIKTAQVKLPNPSIMDMDNFEWTPEENGVTTLRTLSRYLGKTTPQIWGFKPSRREIPMLTNLFVAFGIPLGALGKNPAPGRGVTYHKEFMEFVWNAAPMQDNYAGRTIADDYASARKWGAFLTERHIEPHLADVTAPQRLFRGGVPLATANESTVSEDFANLINSLHYVANLADSEIP